MTKSFQATAQIAASAKSIWAILTDIDRWPEWNTTIDKIAGSISSGGRVTVHAKASPGRAFPLQVTEFDPPRRMVWTGGMPLGLFKGQRTYTLTPKGDNVTEFSMREEFSGLMAPLITRSIPDLQPSFDEFAACLKARAENVG